MLTLFSSNFLSRFPIDSVMKEFARKFSREQKVLDIGCGNKPYEKYFSCQYIGLDPYSDTKADIVSEAWNIPSEDNSYDGVILNQSLEHIEKTNETVSEIKRVLKPGGIGIITVPHTMKNHSLPISSENINLNNFDKSKIRYWNVDYYRFTKFGLISLFKDFQVLSIKETSGYFGTLGQLENYFFASIKPIAILFTPIYFFNNIAGLLLDSFFELFAKMNWRIYNRFYETIYLSLPLNYILIIKKTDEK